jgi:hypothetical protein
MRVLHCTLRDIYLIHSGSDDLELRDNSIYSTYRGPAVVGQQLQIQDDCDVYITDNDFNIDDGVDDIHIDGGTTVTAVDFKGNTFTGRGIVGADLTSKFLLPAATSIAHVGGGSKDYFYDLRTLLASLQDDCEIHLHSDQSYASGTYVTITTAYDILLDLGEYSLYTPPSFFTDDGGIYFDGAGSFTFRNGFHSGALHIDNGFDVSFEDHRHYGKILVGASASISFINGYNSTLRGYTSWGTSAIDLASTTARITLTGGELSGSSALYASINWQADNDYLQMYRVKIGSLFQRAAAQTPTYKSEYCEFNSNPQTSGFWANSIPDGVNGDIYLDNLVPAGGLPNFDQILWVAKANNTTKDGGFSTPFDSIVAAVNAAATLTPSATNIILIYVYPGIYSETSRVYLNEYVHIVGASRNAVIIENANDEIVMSANYSNSSMRTLTIRSNPTSTQNCSTFGGGAPEFYDVYFKAVKSPGSDITALYVNLGSPRFYDCWLSNNTSREVISTSTSTSNSIELINCVLNGIVEINGGDIKAQNCDCEYAAFEIWFGGNTEIVNCRITISSNGILLSRNTGYTHRIVGNTVVSSGGHAVAFSSSMDGIYFTGNQLAAQHPSAYGVYLSSGYTLTFEEFSGNSIGDNGIYVNSTTATIILPEHQTRRMGCMTDAIQATSNGLRAAARGINSDNTIIRIFKSLTYDALLTPPTTYTGIVIEGSSQDVVLSTTTTAHLISVVSDVTMEIRNLTISTTTALLVSINNATPGGTLILRHVKGVGSGVYVQQGDATAKVLIEDCDIDGGLGAAVNVSDADPEVIIRNSRLLGAPAIYWNNVTNNSVKLDHVVAHHSSGAGVNPFGRAGVVTPNYRSHHCAYNSNPEAFGFWTNLIVAAQRFDCVDTNSYY